MKLNKLYIKKSALFLLVLNIIYLILNGINFINMYKFGIYDLYYLINDLFFLSKCILIFVSYLLFCKDENSNKAKILFLIYFCLGFIEPQINLVGVREVIYSSIFFVIGIIKLIAIYDILFNNYSSKVKTSKLIVLSYAVSIIMSVVSLIFTFHWSYLLSIVYNLLEMNFLYFYCSKSKFCDKKELNNFKFQNWKKYLIFYAVAIVIIIILILI